MTISLPLELYKLFVRRCNGGFDPISTTSHSSEIITIEFIATSGCSFIVNKRRILIVGSTSELKERQWTL